jgi:hypothetical protein
VLLASLVASGALIATQWVILRSDSHKRPDKQPEIKNTVESKDTVQGAQNASFIYSLASR